MVRGRRAGLEAPGTSQAAEEEYQETVSQAEGILEPELTMFEELTSQISLLKTELSNWQERYARMENKAEEDRRRSEEQLSVLEERNKVLEARLEQDRRRREEALRQVECDNAQLKEAAEMDRMELRETRAALETQAQHDREMMAEANNSLREALRVITPSLSSNITPRQTPVPAERSILPGRPQPRMVFSHQEHLTSDIRTNQHAAPLSVVVEREPIPKFSAETSASQPLRRNQEVEGWIRQIENLSRPLTEENCIRNARAHCRGPADLIINSPAFDGIMSWTEFKAKLRLKFRGTCSSSDFFRLLYEKRLMSGQAPLDFYVDLEGAVYQGVRDYPEAIGEPDELIRRVFLQGLPGWLREMCALSENGPLQQLIDTAQRVWNARVGIRATEEGLLRLYPSGARAAGRVAVLDDNTSSFQHVHMSTNQLPPRRPSRHVDRPQKRSTCWACQREGHFRRECPFLNLPSGTGPAALGGRPNLQGSRVLRPEYRAAGSQTEV